MSELISMRVEAVDFRKLLMMSVSVATLLLSTGLSQKSKAAETSSASDERTVWISVRSQVDQLDVEHETFVPAFFMQPFVGSHAGLGLGIQHAPELGFDLDVEMLVKPRGSDWSFTGSLRYGRAQNMGRVQVTNPYHYRSLNVIQRPAYYIGNASNRENHTIVDFTVGRDTGIGALGKSSINFGVRFAQFGSQSQFHATSGYLYGTFANIQTNRNIPRVDFARSFSGLGPAVAWEGDVPLAGSTDTGQLSFDWSIHGALLFGKQKMQKREDSEYHQYSRNFPIVGSGFGTRHYSTATQTLHRTGHRTRSVVVPNPGASFGISYRLPNAKMSLGYRADLFLGAIDGGNDAHKSYDRTFYGPFAAVSFGL